MRPIDTQCTMTQIVLPQFTNAHGTVFGGQIAAWADICAAVAAQRFARGPVVTVSIDELHFLRPVKQGMVLELRAMVNASWSSSMEVGVRVEAEDVYSGRRIHCCSAYTTFVALGPDGRATELPHALEPDGDPDWQRRAEEARARREHRLAVAAERRRKLNR